MFYLLLFYMFAILSIPITMLSDYFSAAVSTQTHIFLLSQVEPTCNDGVINSYNFVPDVTNMMKIKYTCTSNSAIGNTPISKTTGATGHGLANMNILDRHSPDCGTGYAISSFSIKNNGTFIWYSYQCKPITQLSCSYIDTAQYVCNAQSHGTYYLSYFLNFPLIGSGEEDTVIQNFQLHMRYSTNSDPDQFLYRYRLCKIVFCDVACNNCYSSYNSMNCKACAQDKGYYPVVDNSKWCVNAQKPGFYFQNNLFYHCLPQCLTCTGGGNGNDHQCTECAALHFPLIDLLTSCYSTPQYGYFYNSSINKWDHCYSLCQYCTNLGNATDHKCTSCIHSYYPLQDKSSNCLSERLPAYFFNVIEQRWDKCYTSCETCDQLGTPDDHKCTSCVTNLYPIENTSQCVDTCPAGYFLDEGNKICRKCEYYCETCAHRSTFCLKCKNEYYLLPEKNSCVSVCPDGYFNNNMERTCVKCSVECKTCQNKLDFCLTCTEGFFFLNNTCFEKCPEGFYGEVSTLTCKPCYESCKTCTKGGSADCLSCIDSFPLLVKGHCLSGCQEEEITLEKTCLKISSCIKYITMDIPDKFPIDYSDFVTKVSIDFTSDCAIYQYLISSRLTYQWEDTYQGTLSEGNTKLTIPSANLIAGLKIFIVNIGFNNFQLQKLTYYCLFRNNKLVPVVKNLGNLSFVLGFQIIIDASLSFDERMIDEAVTSNIVDPDLNFHWQCPNEIATLCMSYTGRILKISPDDYSGLKDNIINVSEYTTMFILTLSKGIRTRTQHIQVTISKPFYESENTTISETSINGTDQKNYEQLICITPRVRGIKGEDIIIEANFLDESIDKQNFRYYWTVVTIFDDSKYLNGRKEDLLRFKNEDLFLGENEFVLEFYELNMPTVKYYKKYILIKPPPPYGGNCLPNRSSGFSLATAVTFSANGWQSGNTPLSYNFYMKNRQGMNISLSDEFIPMSEYTTSIIPVGSEFYVDVMDSQGYTTTSRCSLIIEKYSSPQNANQKKLVLNEMLDKITNAKTKLLLIEAFNSNDFPLDSKAVEQSVNILGSIINTSSEGSITKSINKNMDIILSQLNSISTMPQSVQTSYVKEQVDKVMISVLNNMGKIIENPPKIEGLLNILNNNYDNYLSSQTQSNSTAELVKNDNHIKQIQLKLSENMVSGQIIMFTNNNFISQIGKLSKLNFNYAIIDDSDFDLGKKLTYRRLQQNENACVLNSVVCLQSETIKNISAQIPGDVSIISKLNKQNKLLPISEESFSKTSLDLSLTQQNATATRLLFSNELRMSYTIRLKAPYLNGTLKAKVNDTACVQYDTKFIADSTSCTTWYDYDRMEIVCVCMKQGLIVNVFDKSLSSFSKLAQFPPLIEALMNVYSSSIVGCLIILFLALLSIGYYKDKIDEKKKSYIASKNFDIMQYYLIEYTREGFDKEYSLKSFYWYIIKTNHPILSIIFIYSATYYRTLRVLDFFLNTFLQFFFTFLLRYATENEVKVQKENLRSILFRNLRFDEFALTVQQIIDSVIFAIVSLLITNIITFPLTSLIYSNVMNEEAFQRKNTMHNILRDHITKRKANYLKKALKGFLKVKTFLVLVSPNVSSSTSRTGQVLEIIPLKVSSNVIPRAESQIRLKEKIRTTDGNKGTVAEKPHVSVSDLKSISVSRINTGYSKNLLLQNCPLNKWVFSESSIGEEDFGNVLRINQAECLEFLSTSPKTSMGIYSAIEGKRIYPFKSKMDSHFAVTCTYLSYLRKNTSFSQSTQCKRLLIILKILAIVAIDIVLLIYLLIFIAGIYQNFGTQIVHLCITPLITTFITKLIIFSSLNMLVATVLMYFFGQQIYWQKKFSIKVLLYNLIVPPIASQHHQAILLYLMIMRRNQ